MVVVAIGVVAIFAVAVVIVVEEFLLNKFAKFAKQAYLSKMSKNTLEMS